MSTINSDYFKKSTSDTPIADSLAELANKQLKDLGVEARIKVPSTEENSSSPEVSKPPHNQDHNQGWFA